MGYSFYNIREGVYNHRSITGRLIAAAVAILFAGSLYATLLVSAAPVAATVYDAIPDPLPSNSPSYGFEATQMDELGARIQLEGTDRNIDRAEVVMSSWACENGEWQNGNCATTPGTSFTHPVTFSVYKVGEGGESVGDKIVSVTQDVVVPYRPSANEACEDDKQWMDATSTCFNGLNFTVTFDLGGVILPDEAIYGISYNTHTSGYAPVGQPGDYDALNVSLAQNAQVETGSTSEEIYWAYQNSDFQADVDWSYTPMVALYAVSAKDACKNGGHAAMGFKNQGQCVASVVASENSKHKRDQ